ncbi:large ribosomal subunit protein bL9m isoform X1 [Lepisosteus oculatus]|uniref:large ribosomal subunit protein bL9m isoform X1 n=1 Tax=Lepisosteus oculatus TaxID=7918 RepID=UPI00371D061C
MWGWSRCALDGLIRDFSKVLVSPVRNLSQSVCRQTVVVERWWQVPLSEEGRPPRLHPRRHQVYRLVEDTKHGPREKLELILTQTVPKLGGRGDVVFVKKSLGRNKLLPEGLAVYASPENRQMFEEERRKLWEGKPEERVQTRTGELTVQYLKRCHLEVGMKNNVKYELTKEIVCRQLLRRLGVFVPPHALRLPDEPITRWGEYWCEVTVNGLETVRIPMSVVNFMKPKTRAYKNWLKKEQAESQDSNPDETGKEDS